MIIKELRSTFNILAVNDTMILLKDLDLGRSVTNDAEAVVKWLEENLNGRIGSRKVYYMDTSKRWDQLGVKDGRFTNFITCTVKQQSFLNDLVGKSPNKSEIFNRP